MLKFSETITAVEDYLTANLPGITIEKGKYGELPSLTPCVWIYAQPFRQKNQSIDSSPIFRRMRLTFFAAESAAENKTDAAIKSIELIEQVEYLIFSQDFKDYMASQSTEPLAEITYSDSDTPIDFDSVYSDIAISYLEVLISYSPFWEP